MNYFPLTRTLSPPDRADFDALVASISAHPHFDLRLLGPARPEQTVQAAEAPSVVAGHLAETFFFCRDLLNRLLDQPLRFRLYTTPAAFAEDGGAAGGSFDPERGTVQLLLARLYEGFQGEWPGVAPFLHEFGHLLDFFDASTGRMGLSRGLLPGLSPEDGPLYTPAARALFLKGKRLERDRYLAVCAHRPGPGDPLPIGHPYVFQNDTSPNDLCYDMNSTTSRAGHIWRVSRSATQDRVHARALTPTLHAAGAARVSCAHGSLPRLTA